MDERKPYRDPLAKTQALKRAMKAVRRESTDYTSLCDNVQCDLCRKSVDERSPLNVALARQKGYRHGR